jgi:hypothetical protein
MPAEPFTTALQAGRTTTTLFMARLCSLAEPTGSAQVFRAYLDMMSPSRGVFSILLDCRLDAFTRYLPPFRPRPPLDGKNDLSPGVPRLAQLVSLCRLLKRKHFLKVHLETTLLDHLP